MPATSTAIAKTVASAVNSRMIQIVTDFRSPRRLIHTDTTVNECELVKVSKCRTTVKRGDADTENGDERAAPAKAQLRPLAYMRSNRQTLSVRTESLLCAVRGRMNRSDTGPVVRQSEGSCISGVPVE